MGPREYYYRFLWGTLIVYRALSLGWGVQSFTIACMIALGKLEPIDVAIHADTTHESELTYKFKEKWEPFLVQRGMNVVTVTDELLGATVIDKYGSVLIPSFTIDQYGKKGQITRQCTDNWKRDPIKRYLQKNRNNQQVEILIGISVDEWTRAKDAPEKYIKHAWPLIDMKMSRNDCVDFLKRNNIEIPPKSSCTFCPFKTRNDWSRTRNNKHDWNEAVNVDTEIRNARLPGQLFIHKNCVPLTDADTYTEEEVGQMGLFEIS